MPRNGENMTLAPNDNYREGKKGLERRQGLRYGSASAMLLRCRWGKRAQDSLLQVTWRHLASAGY